MTGTIVVLLIVVVLILIVGSRVARASRVEIKPGRVGIVRRRYGSADPTFRNVTGNWNLRGTQARVLPPGVYWFRPWSYTVKRVPCTQIQRDMIGVVSAREGLPRASGRPVGKPVECARFQDGVAFLANGGEQGVQVSTLPGDHTYYINTELFNITVVPRTYVPDGTIGLVIAKVGSVRGAGQLFGTHVECDNFQDGRAFVINGGQQGRQLAVLAGGTYYDINPAMFDVITIGNVESSGTGLTRDHLRVISIPIGYTGVVVALDGAIPAQDGDEEATAVAPLVPNHQSFQRPWVFLQQGGQRGVQQETLRSGAVCSLNPWFVRVVLIPIRTLILEWTERSQPQPRNYDSALEQIVITIQGHRIFVEMKQTLQISERAAPRLVGQFGEDVAATGGTGGLTHDPVPVQRFIERVLGANVAAFFTKIAGAEDVLDFLRDYQGIQTDLAQQVRSALSEWGVKAEATTLGEFRAEDPDLNATLKELFKAQAELRRNLLEARGQEDILDARIANARKQDVINEIEAQAKKRLALLDLQMRIDLLGPDMVVLADMVRAISNANVPQFVGGSDTAAFLATLPQNMLPSIMKRVDEFLSTRMDAQQLPAAPFAAGRGRARRRAWGRGSRWRGC